MSEHTDQAKFVSKVLDEYRARADFIRPLFFAVPNGAMLGGNRFALASKLKAEGMYNGVADILYLQPRGGFSFLAIEMKTEERRREQNGGISGDQTDWLKAAARVRACVGVCYGAGEAFEAFVKYMELKP